MATTTYLILLTIFLQWDYFCSPLPIINIGSISNEETIPRLELSKDTTIDQVVTTTLKCEKDRKTLQKHLDYKVYYREFLEELHDRPNQVKYSVPDALLYFKEGMWEKETFEMGQFPGAEKVVRDFDRVLYLKYVLEESLVPKLGILKAALGTGIFTNLSSVQFRDMFDDCVNMAVSGREPFIDRTSARAIRNDLRKMIVSSESSPYLNLVLNPEEGNHFSYQDFVADLSALYQFYRSFSWLLVKEAISHFLYLCDFANLKETLSPNQQNMIENILMPMGIPSYEPPNLVILTNLAFSTYLTERRQCLQSFFINLAPAIIGKLYIDDLLGQMTVKDGGFVLGAMTLDLVNHTVMWPAGHEDLYILSNNMVTANEWSLEMYIDWSVNTSNPSANSRIYHEIYSKVYHLLTRSNKYKYHLTRQSIQTVMAYLLPSMSIVQQQIFQEREYIHRFLKYHMTELLAYRIEGDIVLESLRCHLLTRFGLKVKMDLPSIDGFTLLDSDEDLANLYRSYVTYALDLSK